MLGILLSMYGFSASAKREITKKSFQEDKKPS